MSYNIKIKPGYYSSSPYWEEEKLKKRIEYRQKALQESKIMKEHAAKMKAEREAKKAEEKKLRGGDQEVE